MSLSIIPATSKNEEIEIQNQINSSIEKFESILFSAGAGSGKTYALVESLKYILQTHGPKLQYHNQKIICITYTNVAANEIKERLGNSELIKISTIHERLWNLVKGYKEELLKIHISNINQHLLQLKSNLSNNQDDKIAKQFKAFRDLPDESKNNFEELIIYNKELFYKNYDKPAKIIKDAFDKLLKPYPNFLKNISNFKKIVTTIYRIKNYENCLENIRNRKDDYKAIKYDAKYNSDILHRMLISHDTLLDYALKIISDYDLLKQIIFDSYPYILVDEFQDTNEKVVTIIKLIAEHAKKIKHKLFIGYFGDYAQNIYDDGVGRKLIEIHPGLKIISKKFNRRSHQEIIDVINRIRGDGIKQVSIYADSNGGSVKFFSGNNKHIRTFIKKYHQKWNIGIDNKLHCLVLTNRLVAEFSGFIELYNHLSKTAFYQIYYDQLNTELLSNDLYKLGDIPSLFYRIIKFKSELESMETPLTHFLNKDIYTKLTFHELNKVINLLNSISGVTLNEYVKSIFNIYEDSDNEYFKNVIKQLLNLDRYSYQDFKNYLLDKLYPNLDSEEIESASDNLEKLLEIDFSIYISWYEFITDKQQSDIVYHTYHGTKGAEFNNVLILMQNDFGIRDKAKFSSFFEKFKNTVFNFEGEDQVKFYNTRNLLYVSCSRAIQNLRVLYLDNISDFKDGIEKIFGEVYHYEL